MLEKVLYPLIGAKVYKLSSKSSVLAMLLITCVSANFILLAYLFIKSL